MSIIRSCQTIARHDLAPIAGASGFGPLKPIRLGGIFLAKDTLERLARYLNALGHDVEIWVRPMRPGEKRGRLRVAGG